MHSRTININVHRGMVEHAFTPEAVQGMRPAIQKTADELVDGMLSRPTPTDLVEAYALPIPSKVCVVVFVCLCLRVCVCLCTISLSAQCMLMSSACCTKC